MAKQRKKSTAQAAGDAVYAVAKRLSGALSGGGREELTARKAEMIAEDLAFEEVEGEEPQATPYTTPASNSGTLADATGSSSDKRRLLAPAAPEDHSRKTASAEPAGQGARPVPINPAELGASRVSLADVGLFAVGVLCWTLATLAVALYTHRAASSTSLQVEQLQQSMTTMQENWMASSVQKDKQYMLHFQQYDQELADFRQEVTALGAEVQTACGSDQLSSAQIQDLWTSLEALQDDVKLCSTAAASSAIHRSSQHGNLFTALLPAVTSPAASTSVAIAACDTSHLQQSHGQLLPATVTGHSSVTGLNHALMRVYLLAVSIFRPASTPKVIPYAQHLVSTSSDAYYHGKCFSLQTPTSLKALSGSSANQSSSTSSSSAAAPGPATAAAVTAAEAFVDVEVDLSSAPSGSTDQAGAVMKLDAVSVVHPLKALLHMGSALKEFKIMIQVPSEGGETDPEVWTEVGHFEMALPSNATDTSCKPSAVSGQDLKKGASRIKGGSSTQDGSCSEADRDETLGRCQTFKLHIPTEFSQPAVSKHLLRVVVVSNHGGQNVTCMPKLLFHGRIEA